MTSQLDDTALQSWRKAFVGGGLPEPQLARWQALRAGVVNLWEFEAVEYWYAGGWAQLMGRNETGKSSLMALTTLIPWLADTSSDKIDTLGRSGKQFAYYVRPSGEGDRRDSDASFYHGWLWVEYGRVREGTPEFFTTLLYASARTGSGNTKLTWCTSSGSRVRDELKLTDGRVVLAPKEIHAPGFDQHPSAGAYKQVLANRVLGGSIAQLESIGKLLKVTRQPKLGAQLKAEFVTAHLRDSLPELDRSEIEELARGWDQLDQLRTDLARAQDATTAIARFERDAWAPWAQALLRLRADDVAAKQTALDDITREERKAEKKLDASRQQTADLETAHERARQQVATSRAEAEALRSSSAFREASSRLNLAEQQQQRAAEARRALDRTTTRHEKAQSRASDSRTDLDRAAAEQAAASTALDTHEEKVRQAAHTAGLSLGAPLDPELAQQRCDERRTHLRAVLQLVSQTQRADQQARESGKVADVSRKTAENAKALAEQSWRDAEAERDAVAVALQSWAPSEVATMVPGWTAALPRTTDLDGHIRLSQVLRSDYFEPRFQSLTTRRERTQAHLARVNETISGIRREITELQQRPVVYPDVPTLWQRRNRSTADGAPLWQLVNPVDDVPAEQLANVEAALAASGLLDAWADLGERSGFDSFLDLRESVEADDSATDDPSRRLSMILQVAPEAGELTALIQQLFNRVVLCEADEPLPDSGAAVAVDGRWRTSALSGQAAPRHDHAEWLGEAAREAQRRRKLSELHERLADEELQAAGHRAELDDYDRLFTELQETLEQAPSDERLWRALITCGVNDEAAAARQQESDARAAEARRDELAADTARAKMRSTAAEYRLPVTSDGLDQVRDGLHATNSALVGWRAARQVADRAAVHAQQAEHQWRQRVAEADETERELERDKQTYRQAQAQADALRAAIDDDDEKMLDRLAELEFQTNRAESEQTELNRQLIEVTAQKAAAEQKLDDVAGRREEAASRRAEAHLRLRELLDRDLAELLGLELPEPHSSAVDHVRAQAAELRRRLNPRGWQDAAQAAASETNRERLEVLRRELDAKTRDTRAALEQSGRSIQLIPDEPLVRVEVMVDSNGTTLPLGQAGPHLREVCNALESQYGESVRETLDRLLGSTFLEHMRERIGQAGVLIDEINQVLRDHPTETDQTMLRIRLEPGQNASIVNAVSGPRLSDPTVAAQVRDFLKQKVDEAKRAASDEGQAGWHGALAEHLDYRNWYDISLEHRVGGGRWAPLTTRRYAELSGGARAVMLMLPLVAALAAQYRRLPQAPRPLWLDEAFDGLDPRNRSMVMRLLQRFDLDVLLAGPGRLVNVAAVPAAAIYQVVRAPAPEPGADLMAELWAGNTLEAIELPLTWLDGDQESAVPPDQDALL